MDYLGPTHMMQGLEGKRDKNRLSAPRELVRYDFLPC